MYVCFNKENVSETLRTSEFNQSKELAFWSIDLAKFGLYQSCFFSKHYHYKMHRYKYAVGSCMSTLKKNKFLLAVAV
jgi:hypothetical protein